MHETAHQQPGRMPGPRGKKVEREIRQVIRGNPASRGPETSAEVPCRSAREREREAGGGGGGAAGGAGTGGGAAAAGVAVQLGMSKGGTEIAAKAISTHLELNPKWAAFKNDFCNAFNACARRRMVERLLKSPFGHFEPAFRLFYTSTRARSTSRVSGCRPTAARARRAG